MKKTFLIVLPLFFLFFIASCGSVMLGSGEGSTDVRNKYDPALGIMTFDAVINDMWSKWGPPTYITEGNSSDILTLTYRKEAKKLVTKTVYHKADFFDEASSESEQVMESGNLEDYQFVFDKENKLLRWYSHYAYANGHIQENFNSGDQKYKYPDSGTMRFIVGREEKEIVNRARGLSQVNAQAAAPVKTFQVKPVQPAASALEQKLNELKALRDKKLITEAEYVKMREKALSDYK